MTEGIHIPSVGLRSNCICTIVFKFFPKNNQYHVSAYAFGYDNVGFRNILFKELSKEPLLDSKIELTSVLIERRDD